MTAPPKIDRAPVSQLPELIITKEKVLEKLSAIKVNKSQGPDTLHPRLYLELKDVEVDPLRIIFNESLTTMRLPKVWKQANICAIHKKGSKSKPENYRLISLTCIACKIFEQIIRDHIFDFLKGNNLLSEKQYGFISGRSTVLQLLTVLEKWTVMISVVSCQMSHVCPFVLFYVSMFCLCTQITFVLHIFA